MELTTERMTERTTERIGKEGWIVKVRALPVDMIGWFDFRGELNPVSFRFSLGEQQFKGKILNVQNRFEQRFGGSHTQVYTCLVDLEGRQTLAEFHYEKESHKWLLFKI